MANHTLGTIRGTIKIDYDGAGIKRADDDINRTTTTSEKLDRAVDRIGKTFVRVARTAALMGASSLALHSSLQLVAGTIAVLAPLATATFAALPGLILSGAVAIGVLQVATLGMGDALEAAAGPADKFKEAIKNLSPEAQRFAIAVRNSIAVLRPMQQAMQNAFFRGTGPEVTRIARAVVGLRSSAVGVAQSMNAIIREVLRFASSRTAIDAIRASLNGVRNFLIQIRPAIVPLVSAFLGLASQASAFGSDFGTFVAGVLTRFANFIRGVDLGALFEQALPILQSLGFFLQNAWTIAQQFFGIFNVDGANAASVLGILTANLASFLTSAQGQAALTAIGTAMQAISTGAGQVFLALLQALAPALVALSPGIATLAGQIAGVLVAALNLLAPVLQAVAGFLSDNMGWIGPLAGAVLVAAGAWRVYTAATKAWAVAQAVANSAAVTSLVSWARQAAAVTASTAALVANRVALAANTVAGWVRNTAAIVANTVATIASRAAAIGMRAVLLAWTAAQWLLNAAMSANPLGLVVLAVIALIAVIVLLWQRSETFRNIVMAVWNAILVAVRAVVAWFQSTLLPALQAVWNGIVAGVRAAVNFVIGYFQFWLGVIRTVMNAISSVVSAVWGFIAGAIEFYVNLIRTVISAVWNGIQAVVRTVNNAIRNTVQSVWNAIQNFIASAVNRIISTVNNIRQMVDRVRSFFGQLRSAASSGIENLITAVRQIPSRVTSALGNLGSMLYEKGRAMIQGFINGIKDMIGAAGNAAKAVVNKVTGFFPGSPAKEGPLSGRGWTPYRGRAMMEGFAEGIIRASQAPVQAALGAITSTVGAMSIPASTVVSGPSTTTVNRGVSVAPGAVVVHAPQNMNPKEVGTAVASRVTLALATGASSTVGG